MSERLFTASEVIEIANETSDSLGNLYRLDFIDRIRHEDDGGGQGMSGEGERVKPFDELTDQELADIEARDWSAGQIMAAIKMAMEDHDMPAVVSLMRAAAALMARHRGDVTAAMFAEPGEES